MGVAIIIAQFVLSLSLLIVLHELGHFLPARWFRTRVEKFYLFFDPWFSVFKKKIGETEYGIGWLPLGGYGKNSGMIDESMDKEQMKGAPQPWEFRSKPAWQRLIIMLGGVAVNFLLGFLIFGMKFFVWGSEFLPAGNIPYGYKMDSLALEMGLRDGDHLMRVGEMPFDSYDVSLIKKALVIDDVRSLLVQRDGQQVELLIEDSIVAKLSSYRYKDYRLIEPRIPTVVAEVLKGSAAERAGLLPDDKMLTLNDQPTAFYDEFYALAQQNKASMLTLRYERQGREYEVRVESDQDGRIGFRPRSYFELYGTERLDYSLAQAIPAGFQQGFDFLGSQLKAFGKMFSGKIKATESLGGFITIGKLFPPFWSWETFWHVTAVLSLILAFMNLLPIPALDGGHVMFLLFEVITGRKVSDKVMEYATVIGFALILGLILFANGLDVFRLFGKG